MSMKNMVLLQRSGRDQFGNKGSFELIQYEPSEELKIIDSKHEADHKKLNDLFVKAYKNEWLKLFEGFNKKETWQKLCPYGKPSLSAFYAAIREHDSMIQFLAYWLVANKHKAMQLMSLTEEEIKSELSKFNECGCYYVTYGSGRMFGTKSI